MQVRKIPRSFTSVTGLCASNLNGRSIGFESVTGERDFYKVIDHLGFAYGLISGFEEQTVSIHYSYTKEDGNPSAHPIIYPSKSLRVYHPDSLLEFNLLGQKPWLCEIKPQELIRKHFLEYKPVWRAGIKYARQNGQIFKIITDKDVNQTNLKTLSFLRRFTKFIPSENDRLLLLRALDDLHEADASMIVNYITQNNERQVHLKHALWNLIITGKIIADLSMDYFEMRISNKIDTIDSQVKANKHWLFSPREMYEYFKMR